MLECEGKNHIPKLPPYDIIEAVQHLSLTHFEHKYRDAYIGRQLWLLTEQMHTRIAKNAKCSDKLADLDTLWYVCDTIVLLMQVEYKVKYNVTFWKDFAY